MINQVEVRSALGQLLTLVLTDTADGLIVEEIDGLDPVKATLTSSTSATTPGARFQSSRREARNIILTLGLDPDFVNTSVRDLRNQLYQFFMPQSQVSLRFFMSDGVTVDISGRVESFDSALFVQEPKAVISIMCFEPDFVALEPTFVPGATVENTDEVLITLPAAAVETGIRLTLNVDREVNEFTIYHRAGDNVVRSLDFAAPLVADDILTISTVTGSKGANLTRDAVTSSILYGVSPQSNWIQLQPGENHIRVFAVGLPIPYTIEYTTRLGAL